MSRKHCPDNESLRALLRRLHPNEDMDAAMDELSRGHASVRAVPEMSVAHLSTLLPERTAELVHTIPGIARAMLRNNYPAHPSIGTFDQARRFLRGCHLGMNYEQCHLILLRKNQRMIVDMVIQRGTLTSVPFYTRNILEAALAHQADAIILSHNHPGGSPDASAADADSTYSLLQALAPLSIPLLDHIIIAGDHALSMRRALADNGLSEDIWLSQPNNCPALLRNWFKEPKQNHR